MSTAWYGIESSVVSQVVLIPEDDDNIRGTPHIMSAKNGGSHEETIKYVGERNTMKTKSSDIYENGIGAE